MKKKKIYIFVISLVAVSLVSSLFLIFNVGGNHKSGNLDTKGVASVYNSLKEGCSLASPVGGKYEDGIYGIEFDYPANLAVCERHPFNAEKSGAEIYIWNMDDFKSSAPSMGPLAIIYINEALSLNSDLKKLYDSDGFEAVRTSAEGKTIFRKEIQEASCRQEYCKFNIYKAESGEDMILIKEYEDISGIVGSFDMASRK